MFPRTSNGQKPVDMFLANLKTVDMFLEPKVRTGRIVDMFLTAFLRTGTKNDYLFHFLVPLCMRKIAREIGGISCREEDDIFLLYCPHQDDYERLISEFLCDVLSAKESTDKVSIRFGIFTDARQVESIEYRFECAKTAADRVKNDPERNFSFYDQT